MIQRPGLEQIDGSGATRGQVPTWNPDNGGTWQPSDPGGVPTTRTVGTDSTLTGGGDLSANRTLGVDTTAEAERIRDVIGAALVAGSNVTITVNDAGDTITIATATGSAEVLMTDGVAGPPVPLTTEDGTDWLYQG